MKPKYLVILAIIVIALILVFIFTREPRNQVQQPATTPSETVTVLMKEETYEPIDLTIKKGTRVLFKNETAEPRWPASNLHPTHSIYPEFDPKRPVESGSEWSFVFNQVGTWKYHDHLAPLIRGIITVTE
jgi:hypothetical protein